MSEPRSASTISPEQKLTYLEAVDATRKLRRALVSLAADALRGRDTTTAIAVLQAVKQLGVIQTVLEAHPIAHPINSPREVNA